METLHFTI